MCTAKIPGYSFEYVPTPLSSGGVGLFIDEFLSYRILEKISNEAFQALWAENKKMLSVEFCIDSITPLNAFNCISTSVLKNSRLLGKT